MRCLHAGLGVKIIEQNHERCVELAELLPSAVIIEADGSRQDILAAEGISSTDAVITLTNMDEENLIISMYASHIGVPKVITKVNRTEYVEAFKSMGIDTFISPKALCSTDIVRYVRAMQNTTGAALLRCTAWWRARPRRWNSAHPRPRATWARHFWTFSLSPRY